MKIKLFKHNFLAISCLIALVLLSVGINDIGSNKISWAGDTVFPLNLEHYISKISLPWMNIGSGIAVQYNSYVVYYWVYKWILDLGLSNNISTFYYLFLFPTALFSFFGFKLINDKTSNAFFLSVIYTFNPLTLYLFEYTWIFSPFYTAYSVLPVIISSLLFILTKDFLSLNSKINYYYYFAIGCFIASISYGNFPFAISICILVNTIAIFWFLLNRNKTNFIKLLIINLILIFCSLWAVVGQINELIYLSSAGNPTPEFGSLIQWIQGQSLNLSKMLTLNPILGIVHTSKVYLFINFLYGIALFLPLFFIKYYKINNREELIILGFTLVIYFLLCNKGKGWMSDRVIEYVFASNVLIGALRSYDKTIIVINSLILTYISILLSKKIINKFYLYFIVVLSLILSYPFFFGGIQTKFSVAKATSGGTYIYDIPDGIRETSEYLNSKLKISDCFIVTPFSSINSIGWATISKLGLVGVDPLRFAVDSRYYEIKQNKPDLLLNNEFLKNTGCKYIVDTKFAYSDVNQGYESSLNLLQSSNIISLEQKFADYHLYEIKHFEKNFILQCNGIGINCIEPDYKYNHPNKIFLSLHSDDGPLLKIKNSFRPFWKCKILSQDQQNPIKTCSLSKSTDDTQVWHIQASDLSINSKYDVIISYEPLLNWKPIFIITLVVILILGFLIIIRKVKT